VRKDDERRLAVLRIIEQLKEFDSGIRALNSEAAALIVIAQAGPAKCVRISHPLPDDGWRNHDNHGSGGVADNMRGGHGKGDEGFPHADFITQNQTRLILKASKDLSGTAMLSHGVCDG
jgi:hypothetical protein